jgi:release factor glutamine methyltransferase
MESLLTILNKTTEYFRKQGLENPKLDAELLISHVLGIKRLQLYLDFERPMPEAVLQQLRPLLKRRANREPLQYLFGSESFLDFELIADARALIPRPETEELVELVKRSVKLKPDAHILDLGTGTGAIAIALARAYPDARVTATDLDPKTLTLAAENIQRLALSDRIRLVQSNWFAALEGRFDLVVSNPPYLSSEDMKEVAPELLHYEPRAALEAGPSGMECIEHILREFAPHAFTHTELFLEIGHNQSEAVNHYCQKLGQLTCDAHQDLCRKWRFVQVRWTG